MVRAFESNSEAPLLDLGRFFRDLAIVAHLREGRDMWAEVAARFGAEIPVGFGVLAVGAGRGGVLRPFGIRPGRGEIGNELLEYAGRLLEIAEEAYRKLVDFLAFGGILALPLLRWAVQRAG